MTTEKLQAKINELGFPKVRVKGEGSKLVLSGEGELSPKTSLLVLSVHEWIKTEAKDKFKEVAWNFELFREARPHKVVSFLW